MLSLLPFFAPAKKGSRPPGRNPGQRHFAQAKSDERATRSRPPNSRWLPIDHESESDAPGALEAEQPHQQAGRKLGQGFVVGEGRLVEQLATKRQARLVSVRVDGTGYRELYGPFSTVSVSDSMRWTPDSQSIVFLADSDDNANNRVRTLRVSVDGGQPEFDGLDLRALVDAGTVPGLAAGPWNLDLSADGSRMAFSVVKTRHFQLWVLENVMAALNSR